MARTGDGGNEYSPKYRIVGAVIVVFIGFILLSNLLKDKESPESPQTVTGVNERPGATNEVYNASLAETQANTPTTTGAANDTTRADTQAPAATAAPPRVEAVAANTDHGAGEATVAPASAANTHATAAPARRAPAAANDNKGGWVVQVGTFTSSDNAERVREKLKQKGFLVSLENIELKGSKAVRVRVGPYRQKQLAMEAQSKIHSETGLQAVVLAYP